MGVFVLEKRFLIAAIVTTFFIAACSTQGAPSASTEEDSSTTQSDQAPQEPEEQNQIVAINDVPAPSMAGSKYDEKLEQSIVVMLPPSYYTTDNKYPVVYYLHGHGGSTSEAAVFYNEAFSGMETGEVEEFIVVGVSGANKLGGSFYANSPATGGWEDYVTQDVVSYVDENFRTIASSDARGISGFSMGGSGAVNISLKHPDLFSYVFAMSPGLFDENGLTEAFSTWRGGFLSSYGAAFSPNLEKQEDFYDIPEFDGSASDDAIVDRWESGFGDLQEKIQAYIDLGDSNRLKAIHIEYGSDDSYPWIPKGSRYFSELLDSNDIANEIVEFSGGHTYSNPDTVSNYVAFFSNNFAS